MTDEKSGPTYESLPVADRLEGRRLGIFLLVTYGLALATTVAIVATGGLTDGVVLAPGVPLAFVLIATSYMFSPAIGNLLARIATGEGTRGHMLRLNGRTAWPTYAVAWLGTVALVVAGLGISVLLAPEAFLVPEQLPVLVVSAVVLGPAINAVFAFGEAFGWRGYLLPKLLPLGRTRAIVVHGVVRGVWHWPIVALGYNYGIEYPYAPVPGLLTMLLATVALGAVFAWVTLRSASVWPAAIGHGTLNAAGSAVFAFVTIEPRGIVGPAPVMIPGVVPWLVAAAVFLWFVPWSRRRADQDA